MKSARTVRKPAADPTEHDFYERQPIISRPRFKWPDNARMAFGVIVSLEHYELRPPKGAFLPVNLPGAGGRAPYPDVRAFSQREYGNRVGVFRVIDALRNNGMRATMAVDALTAQSSPGLVKKIRELDWEVVGHGHAVTQVMSSRMAEPEETKYIRSSLAAVQNAFGKQPRGWHGPEYGESQRTPGILAKLGLKYVLDWPNDEQPYRMQTSGGPLISVPVAVDFDDVFMHWHRKISMERWQQAVIEGVDSLIADGRKNGRMMMLNLHPWLIGQPWRVTFLEETLAAIARKKGIWHATAGEIADWADKTL